MGKVISFTNHKGGVGKTATAVNLGAALHQLGKKVLLIDLDGQANLTDALGLLEMTEQNNTIYEALKGQCPLPIYENQDGLKVVPSCIDLAYIETEIMGEAARERFLSRLIKPVKDQYDYLFIDCPPSLSILTFNALTASDSVIIPVQSEYLAMRGMAKLTNVLNIIIDRLNENLFIEGVLISKYKSNLNLHQSVNEMIEAEFGDKVYKTIIRENVAIAEATAHGRDIFNYNPKSNGAVDYMELAKEFLKANK